MFADLWIIWWKYPLYLQTNLATSLPPHSVISHKRITLLFPRVKINSGARTFQSCTPSPWSSIPLYGSLAPSTAVACPPSGVRPSSPPPLRKGCRRHSYGYVLPFCNSWTRHWYLGLFLGLCHWTVIWLSWDWVWSRREYGRYISLIDWSIDLLPSLLLTKKKLVAHFNTHSCGILKARLLRALS